MPVVSTSTVRPSVVNLFIKQGSDFSYIVSLQNNDGSVFPLTGYTARLQVRESVASTPVLLEMSTANSKITINGAAGQLTLVLTNVETSALTWRYGVYDLEITSSSSVVTSVMEGNVTVILEVTR